MNSNEFLPVGLRVFFWAAMMLAFNQASVIAIVLVITGFLVIEKYLHDLED